MNNVTLRLKLMVLIVLATIGGALCWPQTVTRSQRQIDFNRDIKPILSDKCFACHGPDAPNLKIKLRLDSEAAAMAELRAGKRAIVPNHPEQSELVRRINAQRRSDANAACGLRTQTNATRNRIVDRMDSARRALRAALVVRRAGSSAAAESQKHGLAEKRD